MLWCSTHPFLYTCSTRCLEDPVKMVNSHISRRFHPTAPFSNVAPDVSQKRRIQSIYRFISAASAYPKCDRRRNEQVIPRGRGNSQKHWEHWWNLGRSLGLINSGLLAWYALIKGEVWSPIPRVLISWRSPTHTLATELYRRPVANEICRPIFHDKLETDYRGRKGQWVEWCGVGWALDGTGIIPTQFHPD